jgi:hypothetical protein
MEEQLGPVLGGYMFSKNGHLKTRANSNGTKGPIERLS